MKKLVSMLLAAGVCVMLSVSVQAQEKPKGKPWPAPDDAVKMKNPVKGTEGAKDLYAQHCKSCHGVAGKGDGPKADKLEISCGDFASEATQKQSDGALYWKITEGRKPMPSYKEKLSDNERWAVVNYLRTLKGK